MLWILKSFYKTKLPFVVIFLCSCTATTSGLVNSNKLILGMSQSQVCSTTLWSTGIYDDPCTGEEKRYVSKNAIILFNDNKNIFLVFQGIQENKSKLVLVASSIEEAEFFIFNLLE
mgnify:FL=1